MRLATASLALIATVLSCGGIALAQEQRMVRISVWDDTNARRIPSQAEIWFRGHGSIFLHQACDRLRNGSLSCSPLDLGMRPVEQALELLVYPSGRKLDAAGREIDEIKATIKVTTSMCRPGCDRDMIF